MSFTKTYLSVILVIICTAILVSAAGWAPDPPEEGSTTNTYSSTLEITELNVKVDKSTDKNVNNGDSISKDAKEQSKIEFEVTVKNLFNTTVEDVTVTATIESIDEGDDLEEESDSFDLDAGDSDETTLKFELPLKVDDDDYNVKIHIEGKDANNKMHTLDWDLTLQVKKERYGMVISKAVLSPSTLSCSDYAILDVDIVNTGREDEDDVSIEVKNEDLGIGISKNNIELGSGDDDDAEYKTSFNLAMPENAKDGSYPISVAVYFNKGRLKVSKDINAAVKGCTSIKREAVSLQTFPPSVKETLQPTQKAKQTNTQIFTSYQEPLLLFSAIILIVLIGAIIFLVGAIIIKLRK